MRRALSARLGVLLLAVAWLAGCAPMHEQLRGLVKEGQYKEAVARGETFLEENRFGPALPEEMYKVETLIAEAGLRIARRTDTVQAYRKFRKAVPETQATAALLARAYAYEAAAWYRDITMQADSLRAHRAFRKRYPDSSTVAKSRLREAQIAFDHAQREGTMRALDRFQLLYKRWPEAAPLLREAAQQEGKVGFDAAVRAGSVDRWRAFNARFSGTEWAKRGAPYEVGLALQEARTRNTVKAYRAFSARYEKVPGIAKHLVAARQFEVEAAWLALGQSPADAVLVAFLRRYEFWPEAKRQGPAARIRLARTRLGIAISQGTEAALKMFLQVHGGWKQIGTVLGQARKALVRNVFARVKVTGTSAAYEEFIERFRTWPEARREVVEATSLSQQAR